MSGCTFLRGGFSLFASHLVGAGLCPYRIHPMASPMRGSCRREATDEVGQLRNQDSHLIRLGFAEPPPLEGEALGCIPAYPTGYVTPSTVMEARSARSMSWENSQVSFTSPLSQLPA